MHSKNSTALLLPKRGNGAVAFKPVWNFLKLINTHGFSDYNIVISVFSGKQAFLFLQCATCSGVETKNSALVPEHKIWRNMLSLAWVDLSDIISSGDATVHNVEGSKVSAEAMVEEIEHLYQLGLTVASYQ
jgi:hypothetical protein